MISNFLAPAAAIATAALLAVSAAAQPPAPVAEPSAKQDSATGAEAGGVVIPNFWDPRRRIERPPAGVVASLRFLTTDDFPPFNFLDANGQLTGFNVDGHPTQRADLHFTERVDFRQVTY